MVKDRIQMQAFTFVVMNIQILLQEEISWLLDNVQLLKEDPVPLRLTVVGFEVLTAVTTEFSFKLKMEV
jgi:hypothetical protein